MKFYSLLVILVAGAFTNLAAMPCLALAQTGQVAQENLPTTAQQEAAKITVRIKIGQGGGSGVLLAKKGSTYLVLTNAHVVRGQKGVTVTTPDGQVQVARRVKNAQVGDFDLALLEFDSARAYQVAKFTNFEKGEAMLNEGREVFAAGFSYDADGLKLLESKITQLPQEAFKNGTQVGYVAQGDLSQGMSGGPILDSFGSLVGINSTFTRSATDNYVYTDGRKAPLDKVAEYQEANWGVPMYNLLTRLNPDILRNYEQLPRLQQVVTPTDYMAELDRKARSVTVRVEYDGDNGSGVIIAKDRDSYYVLTSNHVVGSKKNRPNLRLVTPDQRTYNVASNEINYSGDPDLAIIKFTSLQPYQVATLGDYSILEGSFAFVGGWPSPRSINSQQWQWRLNPGIIHSQEQGKLQTHDKQSFVEGYDLIYSSMTHKGMSGGPVFNSIGQVIGIHGKSENGELVGNSLGVSVKTFLNMSKQLDIKTQSLLVSKDTPDPLSASKIVSVISALNNIAAPKSESTAEEWIQYGNQLHRSGKIPDAIKALDRAISLQPSLDAYYGKGLVLMSAGSDYLIDNNLTTSYFTASLKAFDLAISLIPAGQKSKYYYLWERRSLIFKELGKDEEAVDSISYAINLEPQDENLLNLKGNLLNSLGRYTESIKIYSEVLEKEPKIWAYIHRGVARKGLGDNNGALDDFNNAVEKYPRYAISYYNRGAIKSDLGDNEAAIVDYNTGLQIEPVHPGIYFNRCNAKHRLKRNSEAINDCNNAILIKPKFAEAYSLRANINMKLGDMKSAFSDINRAIEINPNLAVAYHNRGTFKNRANDKEGAILDYSRAIEINPKYAEAYQNRGSAKAESEKYQEAINDFTNAIKLNPNYYTAYYSRGVVKSKLRDKEGALNDYSSAIKIEPRYFEAYHNRGVIKLQLKYKKELVLDDLRISAQLAKNTNNQLYEKIMFLILFVTNDFPLPPEPD